jgi:serine/threonine-protein kinase HSL1 (negative regulator of Swe1 kinase)
MEYVEGGELFEYVAERQRLQEDVTAYLFRQMIWALKYCHGLSIHHRDLKPENILLDYESMTVKLVDFVMLTGYPPFNFPQDPHGLVAEDYKLKGLFQAISRANYRMPGALSREAQDLIRRIFVSDPSKRITIDEVWAHPFIHKYDGIWGLETLTASDSIIALASAQDNWKPLKPRHIDRDIFRALRTLWHSESDTALSGKLCSKV